MSTRRSTELRISTGWRRKVFGCPAFIRRVVFAHLREATATSDAKLYDLANDIGETTDVAAANPKVMRQLEKLADLAREDLGDRDRPGANRRPVGRVELPAAQLLRK